MICKLIEFKPLQEGILIKRYKRFLADIQFTDGRVVTAHCPNTGSMRGLLREGAKVRLSYSPSPKRKLSWTWEQVQVIEDLNSKVWVGVNTLFANKIIRKLIESNLLCEELGDIQSITSEVKYGENNKSRIDFMLVPKSSNPDNRNIFVEVKNTTWKQNNIALFPDSETTRGQKHLRELMSIMPASRGILIPCITRKDVDYFYSGDKVDPTYGNLFRKSILKGLKVIPCCFEFNRDSIIWQGTRPVKSN